MVVILFSVKNLHIFFAGDITGNDGIYTGLLLGIPSNSTSSLLEVTMTIQASGPGYTLPPSKTVQITNNLILVQCQI